MTQANTPLRQRMIDDMRMRKLAPKTQSAYGCTCAAWPPSSAVRPTLMALMHPVPIPRKLPQVLSREEAARLIASACSPKYRAPVLLIMSAVGMACHPIHKKKFQMLHDREPVNAKKNVMRQVQAARR